MKPAKFILPDDQLWRNLGYLRKKYGLSQRSLGKLLFLPPVAIKMMEENRWDNAIPLGTLLRISQIFDVDINALITTDLTEKL